MSRFICATLVSASLVLPPLLGADPPDSMLQSQLTFRENRAAAKAERLKEVDQRLEKGIEELVSLLKSANDSKESKTRVTNLKNDVIKALGNSIGYYRQKRDEMRASLQRPDLGYDPADVRKALDALDERIERRVNQIVELTRSLALSQEFEKYLTLVKEDRFGDGYTTHRINEDWKQNRRVSTLTDQERKKVADALADNISSLQTRERDLQSRLKLATGETKSLLEDDLADTRERIIARQGQLSMLAVPAADGAAQVDLDRARELQDLVKDMGRDLKEDFFGVFRLFNELMTERAAVARLKKQMGG